MILELIEPQTKTAMEEWTISNVRSALESGKLRSPVPEQRGVAEMHAARKT
jgi:hypothetical protein